MKPGYAQLVTNAKIMGLIDVEEGNRLVPGGNSQILDSFYVRHKEAIDDVAESAAQELHLRTGENANYKFMERFAAELPLELQARLMEENLHQALPSTSLQALAFYTAAYKRYLNEKDEILAMSPAELFPEQ
jgi:hypothetical protein